MIPVCPFVRAYIAGHPEYLDLVPEDRRAEFGLPSEWTVVRGLLSLCSIHQQGCGRDHHVEQAGSHVVDEPGHDDPVWQLRIGP